MTWIGRSPFESWGKLRFRGAVTCPNGVYSVFVMDFSAKRILKSEVRIDAG